MTWLPIISQPRSANKLLYTEPMRGINKKSNCEISLEALARLAQQLISILDQKIRSRRKILTKCQQQNSYRLTRVPIRIIDRIRASLQSH